MKKLRHCHPMYLKERHERHEVDGTDVNVFYVNLYSSTSVGFRKIDTYTAKRP